MADDGENLVRFTVAAAVGGGSGETTSGSGVEGDRSAKPAATELSKQDVDECKICLYPNNTIIR
jgi:hypothetical protein